MKLPLRTGVAADATTISIFDADGERVTSCVTVEESTFLIRAANCHAELVSALEQLDAILDFSEPLEPYDTIVEDPEGANETFAAALAALVKAKL